jgi:hypothetical protein
MKKLLIGIGIFALVGFGFLWWYQATYSMDSINSQEVGDKNSTVKFLIASQGSAYKNSLVNGIINHLEDKPVYLKIIDVSLLKQIDPDDWNGLIILHTWEIWKPEPNAASFVSNFYDSTKMLILSTSGSGEQHLDGVDGISRASVLENVPADLPYLLDWLDKRLVDTPIE